MGEQAADAPIMLPIPPLDVLFAAIGCFDRK
jgi:hypothetical protein